VTSADQNKPDEIVEAFFVLELRPPTTIGEVERSYKRLAMLYHPDKKGGDTTRFQEIQTAREVLSREAERLERIRLYVGSKDASALSELGQLQGELHEYKLRILNLNREKREVADSVGNFASRQRAKTQLALALASVCMVGLAAAGVLFARGVVILAPDPVPDGILVEPGSFPVHAEVGEVKIHFEETETKDSRLILSNDQFGDSEPQIELESGSKVTGGKLVLPSGAKLRLRSSDISVFVGKEDAKRLRTHFESIPIAPD